jgi:GTP-binding protein
LIRDRILREAEDDVSLRVNHAKQGGDNIEISGRGDLHLGVLIEKMRREGYEMSITPPQVVMQPDPVNPKKMLEPFEEVIIEADLEFCAMIIEKMNNRKGVLLMSDETSDGK